MKFFLQKYKYYIECEHKYKRENNGTCEQDFSKILLAIFIFETIVKILDAVNFDGMKLNSFDINDQSALRYH